MLGRLGRPRCDRGINRGKNIRFVGTRRCSSSSSSVAATTATALIRFSTTELRHPIRDGITTTTTGAGIIRFFHHKGFGPNLIEVGTLRLTRGILRILVGVVRHGCFQHKSTHWRECEMVVVTVQPERDG